LKIKLTSEKVATEELLPLKERFASENNITLSETNYFIFKGKIKNQAYNKTLEPIRILKKDETIEDVVDVSDQLSLKALSKAVTKYYICYPKQLQKNSN
jgi:predicted transcriptional regulator